MRDRLIRNIVLLLVGTVSGCTSFVTQQQGKLWPSQYADCPNVYARTRLELSSLEWALSDDSAPPDPCLAHYFPKAKHMPFYRDTNRYLVPGYLLSLPADVIADTITFPFSNW